MKGTRVEGESAANKSISKGGFGGGSAGVAENQPNEQVRSLNLGQPISAKHDEQVI
jgi:hypothetical protein